MGDDTLVFLDDEQEQTPVTEAWKILIVDDEPEIHSVTKLVLNDFVFDGRRLQFLSAYSAQQAKTVLQDRNDIALIFLDVVMEEQEAGLKLVHYIRRELGNQFVRIILRTGQPGYAPEAKVVMEYDINDYKEKTELTAQRLVTALISALRSYRDLTAIENNKRGLEQIIKASPEIFRMQSLQNFANGVLTQLTSLLYLKQDALYLKSAASFAAAQQIGSPFQVLAATGRFEPMLDQRLDETASEDLLRRIRESLDREQNLYFEDYLVMYRRSANGASAYLIYLEGYHSFSAVDRKLMDVFCQHVSAAFENLNMHHEIDITLQEIERRELLERELQRKTAELDELRSGLQTLPDTEAQIRRISENITALDGYISELQALWARCQAMKHAARQATPELAEEVAKFEELERNRNAAMILQECVKAVQAADGELNQLRLGWSGAAQSAGEEK